MSGKSIYFITIVKRLASAWKEAKNGIKGEKRLDVEEGCISLEIF